MIESSNSFCSCAAAAHTEVPESCGFESWVRGHCCGDEQHGTGAVLLLTVVTLPRRSNLSNHSAVRCMAYEAMAHWFSLAILRLSRRDV